MKTLHETAMAWANAGFCVVRERADESKGPIGKWEQYIATKHSPRPAPPSPQIVDAWYSSGQTGVGLITGAVSGNAEMFEFEGRALEEGLQVDFTRLCAENGAAEIWDRLRLGYTEKTRGGGLHFIFRVSDGPALPCMKLAQRPSTEVEIAARLAANPNDHPEFMIETLLETRGEGGHVIIAPTVKSSGAWTFLSQTPGQVASLTCAERDLFYDIARMLNQIEIKEPIKREPRTKVAGKVSPFDAYRAETDWHDFLPEHGWTHVVDRNGTQICGEQRCYWVRPGKGQGGDGWTHSASTGNTNGESDSLWVWSTTAGLPVKEGLSKEYVYAHYNHGGDLSEAARSLREQGYGDGGGVSRVEPGNVNPFSDGFDPAAWAESRARETGGSALPPAGEKITTETGENVQSDFIDWHALWLETDDEEWIIPGFLPARRAVAVYSKPKLGKSLLLLELAVHVSRGTEFLGVMAERMNVLYVDHENDPRGDIRARLKAMGFGPDDLAGLKYLSFPDMATLDTAEGGVELIQKAAQARAGLIVIDTVSRTVAGEENSNDTWLQFYRHTGKHLKAAGIAYVRLDHTGKNESNGQRGGSAKSGDVDAIWQLTHEGRDRFALLLDGGRMKFPAEKISFTREEFPTKSVLRAHQVETDGSLDEYVKAVMLFVGKLQGEFKVPGTEKTMAQLKALWGSKKGDAAAAAEYVDRLVQHGWLKLEQPDKENNFVVGPNFGDPNVPAATPLGFIQVI